MYISWSWYARADVVLIYVYTSLERMLLGLVCQWVWSFSSTHLVIIAKVSIIFPGIYLTGVGRCVLVKPCGVY